MDELHSALKSYVLWLEKHGQLWQSLVKKVTKPMNRIIHLSEQLKAVSSIQSDVLMFEQFPEIKERLIARILISLEQELTAVVDLVEEIKISTDKLNTLLATIEHINGIVVCGMLPENDTICQVSISKMIEGAHDCKQYYQAGYAELSIALLCLDFRDLQTVAALRMSFFEDKELKKKVTRYLGATYILAHGS